MGSLTVCYLLSERTSFAVCVGKKFGKSVKRNRIKRLLRETLRAYAGQMKPCKLLLIPKVAEEYSLRGFSRDFEKILKKEELLES